MSQYLKQRGNLKLTKKKLLLSRGLAGDRPGEQSLAVSLPPLPVNILPFIHFSGLLSNPSKSCLLCDFLPPKQTLSVFTRSQATFQGILYSSKLVSELHRRPNGVCPCGTVISTYMKISVKCASMSWEPRWAREKSCQPKHVLTTSVSRQLTNENIMCSWSTRRLDGMAGVRSTSSYLSHMIL